ncbi:MAG: hypothetical protein H7263_12775 [Candidatus Sericytochromatia bacterium]|nr:hypothetical protein [Candidatus Sericytochromatia bacterium]
MIKTFSKYLNYAHRYLGLIIFLQVILWSFSGFFMYYLDFSDLYISPPDKPIDLNIKLPTIQDVVKKNLLGEKILNISLKNIAGNPFYDVKTDKKEVLVDQNNMLINKLSEKIVEKISTEKYIGKGQILSIKLLEKSKGNFYSLTPVYKVSYDDAQKTELYINPNNGELLAKRKALWGFYNNMWEYHLMKYTTNTALNKNLLLISAIISLFVSVTGFLKFFRIKKASIYNKKV